MEHEKQVQNVKKALELETHAEALRESLHIAFGRRTYECRK